MDRNYSIDFIKFFAIFAIVIIHSFPYENGIGFCFFYINNMILFVSKLKGVAIIFMLLLHLFCRKEVNGLYETFPVINGDPLVYYLALFGDACVPIFCFASGYGLLVSFQNDQQHFFKSNNKRILILLVNFWIILIAFVAIGYIAGIGEVLPGSLKEFTLNFFLLSNSYNGAWWFLQTYLLLVYLSPFIFKLIKKYNSMIVLVVVGSIYLLTYIQRIKFVIDFGDNIAVIKAVNALVLLCTSLLPFVVGSIFVKKKIYSKIYKIAIGFKRKNLICTLGILLLVIGHSLYESMIIAPFTAIGFICFFNLMEKNILVKKILEYLGGHSTNIWLTHMFCYMSIFPEITFAPKYPILIFLWLVILCLISSFGINAIFKPFNNLFDRSVFMNSKKFAGEG
jgi:surface polysaccharide O-acyltransferase-like enzyme